MAVPMGFEPIISPVTGANLHLADPGTVFWRRAEKSNPMPFRARSAFEAVPVPDRFTLH